MNNVTSKNTEFVKWRKAWIHDKKGEHCQWPIKFNWCCRKWNYQQQGSIKVYSLGLQWYLILAKSNVTILGNNGTQVAFKNFVLFSKCITKIDGTTIGDGEDL